MALVVVVYKTPKNAAALNDYYFNTHVPVAKKIPGVRGFRVSDGPIELPVEPGGVHLVALPEFDSLEALQKGVASPEGQAATADLANFADGGVDLMVFDTKDV